MIRIYTICIYIGSRIHKYSVNNDGFHKYRVEMIGAVGLFMIRLNRSGCIKLYGVLCALVEMLPVLHEQKENNKQRIEKE